jgi:hypothetical protein
MTKKKSRIEQIITTVTIVPSIGGLDLGVFGASVFVGEFEIWGCPVLYKFQIDFN